MIIYKCPFYNPPPFNLPHLNPETGYFELNLKSRLNDFYEGGGGLSELSRGLDMIDQVILIGAL